MAQIKYKKKETIVVDGIKFIWWISSVPRWGDRGIRGIDISVELERNPQKSLLIQMPYIPSGNAPNRSRPKMTSNEVKILIVEAMNEGWKPFSRGKPYKYVVPKTQP